MPKIARTAIGVGALGLGVLGCGGSVNGQNDGPNFTDAGTVLPDSAKPSFSCSQIQPEIRVSDDSNGQLLPTVASDGKNFLIAWSDFRHGDEEIYARAFMQIDGKNVLSPESQITDNQSDGLLIAPSIASSGDQFEATAIGQSSYFFAQISHNGQKIGLEKKIIDVDDSAYISYGYPAMAWSTDRLGMVWNARYGEAPTDLYFQQFTKTGDPIGQRYRLTHDNLNTFNRPGSSIVGNDDDFGITYFDENGVGFIRVNKNNGPTGSATTIAGGSFISFNDAGPSIAWTGSKYAVAWSKFDQAPEESDSNRLLLTFLSKEGKVLGPDIPITDGNSLELYASIIWNENLGGFGQTWINSRWDDKNNDWETAIKFIRLSETGEKIGPEIVLAKAPGGLSGFNPPAIASAGSGFGVTYARSDDQQTIFSYFSYIDCQEIKE